MTKPFNHMTIVFCFIVVIFLIVSGCSMDNFLQDYTGTPDPSEYKVKGIDVSSYQGRIQWDTISEEGLTFAFIKATEGSSFKDECFDYNWREAHQTSLFVGAYHFFSFDSSGSDQAGFFIKTVPKHDDSLPPVIDLEFYGTYSRFNAPDAAIVQKELIDFLTKVEAYYGKKPIIYTSKRPYNLYLSGSADFSDYPLWIVNYHRTPVLDDGRDWTFWQYSAKGQMEGYAGLTPHIDLNVYNGTYDQFISRFSAKK